MESQWIQGSDEWLAMRRSYIMASDAPAIMGVSPWRSQFDIWKDKLGLLPPLEDNHAMQRGRELEPRARALYEDLYGHKVTPDVIFHGSIPYMGASLDGYNKDLGIVLEIKCPGREDHLRAKDGKVPKKYIAQLQHQMEVAGVDNLIYFSYTEIADFESKDGKKIDYAIVVVDRDQDYIDEMLACYEKFWECVENVTEPELSNKDLTFRDDTLFVQAENERIKIMQERKSLDKRDQENKNTLIKLADKKSCVGSLIKVQLIQRQGVIDYTLVPELKDVDLEPYRKKGFDSWRISENNSLV